MDEYETIIVAIIVAATGLITNWYNQKQWKTQNKAQFLSNFLKYRYEAIRDLFGNFIDCRTSINSAANWGSAEEGELREIGVKLEKYIESKRKAEIWLDKDTYNLLNEAMAIFNDFHLELKREEPLLKIKEWETFSEITYKKIIERLRDITGINVFEEHFKEIKK